jgi:hypothetical protein
VVPTRLSRDIHQFTATDVNDVDLVVSVLPRDASEPVNYLVTKTDTHHWER